MPDKKKTESVAEILKRKRAEAKGQQQNKATEKPTADKVIKISDAPKPGLTSFNKIPDTKTSKEAERTLRNQAEYLMFIEFMATPKVYREIQTIKEFSKKIKVSEQTLSEWQKRSDYHQRFRESLKGYIRDNMVGNAIASMQRKIMKEGNASEVKLLLQVAEMVEDRSIVETPPTSNLTTEQMAGMAERLRLWKKVNLEE